MNFYIDKIQKFFSSVAKYFSSTGYAFSWLFIIFVGLFVLTTLVVIISTSFSYEFVLTRAIEKINKFLSKNPRINDDNLIAFNNKMKERKIPKVLRRQWQQFMLYREHEASYYMSFRHCVENPLRTSTYSQQSQVYRVISIVLIALSVLLGIFTTYQTTSFVAVLRDVLIIPIFILVLFLLISMIMNLIHNATTGDLYQNYQYFEINIDKATLTLPEYVDYEVLFTQDEIKRGIPVLFEYIQKRAIEEQKELEKARIKNVEHEKFSFDESGLEASLVLERSMQEAENYIATRKKFRQDIEQVNNEIAALENQYKENVKENQRLMQTSKESVDGLKKQLEQANSSIEINYIKKQMKDEINRQQVAERDFDALTDKYNKETKSLQEEIDRLENEISNAKKQLENSMMSEFHTYSSKVYDQLETQVNGNQQTVIDGYKNQINDLEEKLALKDEELDNVYSQYQTQVAQLEEKSRQFDEILKEKDDIIASAQDRLEQGKSKKNKKYKKNINSFEDFTKNEFNLDEKIEEPEFVQLNDNLDFGHTNDGFGFDYKNDENVSSNDNQTEGFDFDNDFNQDTSFDYFDNDENQKLETNNKAEEDNKDDFDENIDFNYLSDENAGDNFYNSVDTSDTQEEDEENDTGIKFDYLPESNKPAKKASKKETSDKKIEEEDNELDNWFDSFSEEENDEEDSSNEEDSAEDEEIKDFADLADVFSTDDKEAEEDFEIEESEEKEEDSVEEDFAEDIKSFTLDDEDENEKEIEESEDIFEEDEELETEEPVQEKVIKRPGRPRKIVDESEIKPKRKPGRPRKIVAEKEEQEKRKPGRPKKVEVKRPGRPKKARPVGRPKKNPASTNKVIEPKKSVGRPKLNKEEVKEKTIARPVGRPKKVRPVGRPKKVRPVGRPKGSTAPRPVGRPKKNIKGASKTNINEIDKQLKALNSQIKKENNNIHKTQKQLEKVSLAHSKKRGRR